MTSRDDAVKRAPASRDDLGLVNCTRLARDVVATGIETPNHYFPFPARSEPLTR